MSLQSGKKLDMLHGSMADKILIFALPLAASSILQQLFNAVDVAVVGRFASSQAQAAVGSNGPLINLLLNLFIGISVGANVVIANYIGRGEQKRIRNAVHTAMLVASISGIFLLFLGIFVARPLLTLMNTPEDVIEYAVVYLRIYFLGMPFIMIYNFGAAILRSMGDTKRPLYCLILSGVVNAALNLLLVIRFHMDAAGVGIATVAANIINAVLVLYFLLHEQEPFRLEPGKLKIHKQEFFYMLRIGIPAGLQSMVFSFANVCIQSVLNGYGSDAVAGSAVALNFEYFSYFVVSAFNQATVTFTSQNYGAGQYDRCRKVYRLAMAMSVLASGALSLSFLGGRGFFISLFTDTPAVAEYAAQRMLRLMAWYFILNSYEISGSALRGLGYSMMPAVITVFGTCVLRLVWAFTVCKRFTGFGMLMNVYPLSWIVTGIAMVAAYLVIRQKALKRV
ncbi:MAG: MATE family efflux transporter [Lachnospiraceae bacterium]|nr:MATE family efflux transporter [Lachnospiraceae bacterium]